jgi:glycosyltransferase involved in cell wall biosynthesis
MSSVSVVVPCYQYGHFLPDCLRSVLADQAGVDVRVLVIDDASPDDSADVAHAIAAQDSRVEVVVHAENRGHIATYNEGLLEWADGDYCVLLSADDLLAPGALSRATALLDAHPSVGFVYGRPQHFFHGDPLPRARSTVRGWSVWNGQWWLDRRFRDAHGCITSPEVVARTALQKRVGGYDPALPHAGDIEMWMRLAAHADVGYVRGPDQAYYRMHRSNMHTTRAFLDDLVERRKAYRSVLDRCRGLLPDAQRLANVVDRRLARDALRRAFRAYDRGRVSEVPIDELVRFAAECWPAYQRLPEYRALAIRRRVGPRIMPYLQPLAVSAVGHKVRERLWWESWKRRGI